MEHNVQPPSPLPAAAPHALNTADPLSGPAQSPRVLRSVTANIKEEGRELREAAEQSLNVILELSLDGFVRWASPGWQDVVGTSFDEIQGRPISDIVLDNKSVFDAAIRHLRKDESGSKVVRFSAVMGPKSLLRSNPADGEPAETTGDVESEPEILHLEAQGIIIYDRSTGQESHTMWMIRPAVQLEITIDLPEDLIKSLGVGAEILARHLTKLAEQDAVDPDEKPPPEPVLCRICERQITPWWFPKHTEMCLQEHRAEAEIEQTQDSLNDHRNEIVKVLDALEAQSRHRSSSSPSSDLPPTPPPHPEYKGMAIAPPSTLSSGTSSGNSSPLLAPRDRSSSRPRLAHHRQKSFTVRRPTARVVELILDLCDTALEISTPAVKDTPGDDSGEIRTQSPQSEGRISQVLQWQSPSASALENAAGLTALCEDTAKFSREKVDAVLRYRRILEYSERIRTECTNLVQECIDAALEKASRIAAGEDTGSSDSSDDSTSKAGDTETEAEDQRRELETIEQDDEGERDAIEQSASQSSSRPLPPPSPQEERLSRPYDTPGALATAFRQLSTASRSPSESPRRRMSSLASTRSSSPRGCPTPRSYIGVPVSTASEPSNPHADLDPGAESDTSMRSTARSQKGAMDSPRSELDVPRVPSRERKRTSLILPSRGLSTHRHRSASRPAAPPPLSPVITMKARESASASLESQKSPMMSPTLSSREFASPAMPPPLTQSNSRHHRRQSSVSFEFSRAAALSPRLGPTSNPHPRSAPPSIKDFDIIKPISKGAFGSVYLAKKKSTGDYYAIKALKKADMIAKNQVQNVKAERAILMWQGESDFVAKLYWTFPSKDYIFLVSEYLNGGDCASLIKAIGVLPEDWAKRYMAEVVLGVEHLHQREIVHRDLKPDNLLIDQKGHLKLTDFGLSRMGLIGRQKRALARQADVQSQTSDPLRPGSFARSLSMASSRSTSFDYQGHPQSPASTPNMTPVYPTEAGQPSYFNLSRDNSTSSRDPPHRQDSSHHSDISDTDQLMSALRRFSIFDDNYSQPRHSPRQDELAVKDGEDFSDGYPLHHTMSNTSAKPATPPLHSSSRQMPPPPPPMALFDPDDSNRRFVGTPDYLAPETISGLGQDEMSDWWSLGCILFEFVFGYPPFHSDTPEKVFENILSRKIDWPPEDDENEVSAEAKDLMSRLMTLDPSCRLGSNFEEKYKSGGEEIRSHPWFSDINWDTLLASEASFVPAPADPEDTEYFDARGATHQDFAAEFEDQESSPALTPSGKEYADRPHDALSRVRNQVNSMKRGLMPLHIPPHVRDGRNRRLSEPAAADDFGQFSFKNLPILEKANKDVIQKLRAEALQVQNRPANQPKSAAATTSSIPHLEGSPLLPMPLQRALSQNKGSNAPRSSSPSNYATASPNRGSQPTSPLVQFSAGGHHERRKTSNSSAHSGSSMQAGSAFDIPKMPPPTKPTSLGASPVRHSKSVSTTDKGSVSPNLRPADAINSPRSRSQTVGSNEKETIQERVSRHQKQRSQALDVSPSSSDNDETRQKLLRVRKRRQSSRRLSHIALGDVPTFRPLDILVCEDHPVSRLVINKLLEKLRCRTIVVQNGAEAMRYALGNVKFDLIMMEYSMPQVNGVDVAKMIRETKNTNCHTPIVCITGYLKELQAPHNFDALVEKPASLEKLKEVMSNLCQWRPAPPGWTPKPSNPIPVPQLSSSFPLSSLRNESVHTEDSPTSPSSGFHTGSIGSSYHTGSRDDSISSVSGMTDDMRSDTSSQRQFSQDWKIRGLGISSTPPEMASMRLPTLISQESAPAVLEEMSAQPRRQPSAEKVAAKRVANDRERAAGPGDMGDDEDEDLGRHSSSPVDQPRSPRIRMPSQPRHASKLSTEMLRTDSTGSVISIATRPTRRIVPPKALASTESSPTLVSLPPPVLDPPSATTPPESFAPTQVGDKCEIFDMDADERVPRSMESKSISSVAAQIQQSTESRQGKVDEDEEETPRASVLPTPSI